jgi:ribose 5-phosphate isomerase B
MKQKIAIGNDHAGTDLKNFLINEFHTEFEFINKGTNGNDSVDYPDYAKLVSEEVQKGQVLFGILICGSANGVCMAANKYESIRAGLAWNEDVAKLIKQHNNANIVCIPARFVSNEAAKNILSSFINSSFEGGRHQNRIDKIGC